MRKVLTEISTSKAERRTFKYFNIMYATALTIIAVVTMLSQFAIQSFLDNQLADSKIVNIAGRQRMLSQQISKMCLLVERNSLNQQLSQQLNANLRLWEKNHNLLKEGKLSRSNSNSKEIDVLFSEIEPYIQNMIAAANQVIAAAHEKPSDKMKINNAVNAILSNEFFFLQTMDEIVDQYEKEAREKVYFLKRIEYWMLILVLVILSFEVLLIFKPVARKIKQVIKGLEESEKKTNEMNVELQKSVMQNRDFNFALNKATVLIRIDEKGRILYANNRYCTITKYSHKELLGKKLFLTNEEEENSIIYEHINDDKVKHNVWQGEILDQGKYGDNFWLDVTLVPIINAQGNLYQYLVVCSDLTARKLAEKKLQELSEKKLLTQKIEKETAANAIVMAQENERKLMASEIHDGIGQMLTALKFDCEALEPKDEMQREDIDHIKKVLYSTIKEARRISSSLLPNAMLDFGLGASLKELIRDLSYNARAELSYHEDLSLEGRLINSIETTLYRIAQEGLTNALKHSKANRIQVILRNDSKLLTLIIKDDGIGFNAQEVSKLKKQKDSGLGLTNMRERAELIKASYSLEALPDLGTIITVKLVLTHGMFQTVA